MVLAHDLDPALAGKLRTCTLSYAFSAQLKAAFQGSDRYVPLNYKQDFDAVRAVALKSGAAIRSGAASSGSGIDRKDAGQ
jgi:phosphonate transport system substrate-binding protein